MAGKKQSSLSRFFARASKKEPEGPKQPDVVASPIRAETKASVASPKAAKAVDALRGYLPSKRAKESRQEPENVDSTDGEPSTTQASMVSSSASPSRKLFPNTSPPSKRSAPVLDTSDFSRSSKMRSFGLEGFEVPKDAKLTPLEQQFIEIKRKYPTAILLVEVGYKYQFFGRDAEVAAEVLHIFCAEGHNNFKTASIPVHRLFVHVRRLVEAGYKVGVVKQTETAALKKAGSNKSKPFTRELSAMYTKATLIGEDVEPDGDDNAAVDVGEAGFLCCLFEDMTDVTGQQTAFGLVAINCTTGDMIYDCFEDDLSRAALETHLSHIDVVELLLPMSIHPRTTRLIQASQSDGLRQERLDDKYFSAAHAASSITDFFTASSPTKPDVLATALNLPQRVLACMAALLHHLKEFKLERLLNLTSSLRKFSTSDREMVLNACALRNLDILREQSTGGLQGSLLWLLDHTSTPFGRRLLRHWVSRPLLLISEILERQRTVDLLCTVFKTGADDLRTLLSSLPDIERGLVAVYSQRCSPRELYALVSSISRARDHFVLIKAHSVLKRSPLLAKLVDTICEAFEPSERFIKMMNKEAALINDKVSLLIGCDNLFPTKLPLEEKLVTVKESLQEHRRDVAKRLRVASIDYITVSGEEYLIEVARTQSATVPKDWLSISATKQKVRYRTPFIIEQMELMAQCTEQLQIDAAEAWRKFMESFSSQYDQLRQGIKALATLDCLLSLAHTAMLPGYVKPTFIDNTNLEDDEGTTARLNIVNGRHPMVSAALEQQFVPNSTHLSGDAVRCMVVTGPNMGGKSSYIKQVALIVIMAQIGCFVPAESAELTVFSNIFTRMGASDDIQKGQSTFMTELREASDALRHADSKALVIMDELGRGTSTHDGVAIAYATLEYLVATVKCICLFVTHYPSMAELTSKYPQHILCTHMNFVEETEPIVEPSADESTAMTAARILFLHQLVKGLAKKSYGLNVARLANLPETVLTRAAQKSNELEKIIQERRSKETMSMQLVFADALCRVSDAQSAVNLLSALQQHDSESPTTL
eukprot:m.29608 g.29608  ORF g.29608 m.29608 type:complete len:1050 (-) comp10541_c0_seq3:224-3373(-)